MRKLLPCLRSTVLFIVLMCISTGSYASHILGIDLYYTWVSGNTYTITVILYGDCSPASSSAFSYLPTSMPQVCVYRGTTNVATINLNIQAPTSGVDITPVCPSQVGHTQCQNSSSTIPGIKKFVYTANYTLPAPVTSNCWQFAYFGYNGLTQSAAGRSASITNLSNPGATDIQLVDTLDNTVYANNSNTQFTVIPTPFYCINTPNTYNPGCVDPNNDSLNISLIPAKNGNGAGTCSFGAAVAYTGTAWTPPTTPVSGTNPLRVVAGTFSLNSFTGQLNFTPNAIQRATVVYNVREFRNGTYVGSCQREMNFLVQTCTNTPPTGGLDSVINGILVDSAHYTICTNSGPFTLHMDPREPGSSNNITVTSSGLPVGSAINVVNNGTPTPHVTFSWTSNGVAPGTYIFYLTYTDNNCPLAGSTTVAITIVVTPSPIISYTVVAPATCNSKAAINVIPSGTGAPWNISVTGTTPQSFTGVTGSFIDSLSPGIDTMFITSSIASACNSSTIITITTTAPPPTMASNTPCADSTLFLSTTTTGSGITYSWTGPNGFTSTLQNPSIPNAQTIASGMYTLTIVNGTTGCTSLNTLNVTVKPTPAIPVVSGSNVCETTTLNLGATSDPGSTYSWTGPASFVSGIQNPTITPANIVNTGTYTVVATLNGCPSLPGVGSYTVYPIPPAPIGVDSTYCQGAVTAPLNATGANMLWYTAATGGIGSTIIPVPSDTTVGVQTWYVTQTINGCESPRAPVNTTILYLPVFTITGNTQLCSGATTTLSYTGPALNAPGYLWVIPFGATVTGGSVTSDAISMIFDSTHTQYVTLTASDYGGKCATTDTVKIIIEVPPLSQFYIKPDLCIGDTVQVALSYRTPDAVLFTWDFAGAQIVAANANSGGPYSLSWMDTGIHIIKLITTTDLGCTTPPVYDSFNVHGLPDARIQAPVSPICLDDTITLSAVTDVYDNHYAWTPAHFFEFAHQPLSKNNSTVPGIIQVKGDVTLTVTDPFGCTASESIYLDPAPCCIISFPSAFTPNGDGHNDVFRPISSGYHTFHVFRIVNRWGQVVFETSNSNQSWDGTFSGVPQDMGVYYYFLRYDCDGKTLEAKGDVTLIR